MRESVRGGGQERRQSKATKISTSDCRFWDMRNTVGPHRLVKRSGRDQRDQKVQHTESKAEKAERMAESQRVKNERY